MDSVYLSIIKSDYGREITKTRKFQKIRKLFDLRKKNEYTLDDQTWNDFDMDKVFEKLDRTYSSAGEASLYSMLRNPLSDENDLKMRGDLVQTLMDDSNLREKISLISYELHWDKKSSFIDMIENDLIINKPKFYIYTLLGKILPIVFLICTFINIQFIVALLSLGFVNVIINNTERKNVKSNGIMYLRKIINASKSIRKIKNPAIDYHKKTIDTILNQIKAIDSGTSFISFANIWGGFFEVLALLFLLEESSYYAISDKINNQKDLLMDLYYTIGELDALASMASFKQTMAGDYSKPKFIKDIQLNITGGIHPILKKPVPNSISINNHGIVLTGTNMSGKSTFLRMLGINILLAQTFYFVLAKSYEAPFFNIVSSISPSDDVTQGKSYFMAEVESLFRVIKATEKPLPVFCAIDEIFRGTNPIERIAMSAEILTYLNNGTTLSIVSTHDRELTKILKDDFDFYYFSEDVDSKTGLSFDYKLKKGISQTKNAIKLLEYMNYPKIITEKAFKRAEKIDEYSKN
ncbi:MAG: DNA mismatch repair protein MutS [Bacillota bacterium]|nr:DNA mismatch repair protein MutS [Bacillota bacterium]